MNNLRLSLLSLLAASSVSAQTLSAPIQQPRLIETTPDLANLYRQHFGSQTYALGKSTDNQELLLVADEIIEKLSSLTHRTTHRCGGFMDLTNLEIPTRTGNELLAMRERELEPLPVIRVRSDIQNAIAQIDPRNIEAFVKQYSGAFKTRYAKSEEGKKAPEWLAASWKQMAARARRADILVEVIPFNDLAQPSVRLTIAGTDPTAPIVVLGGHLDSINGWGGGGAAPGMDDNASGIATITEVYRVMLAARVKPKNTVQFFGYSGEELGLLGSARFATAYAKLNAKVRGVMQLDMTSFAGKAKKITFMQDYTSTELSRWTEALYGQYVGLPSQHDKCGYGCSDHASWHRQGYPAVMPFEATMAEDNKKIHTPGDVWEAGLDADYAALFSKLAYAFVVTLATE